MKLLLGPS